MSNKTLCVISGLLFLFYRISLMISSSSLYCMFPSLCLECSYEEGSSSTMKRLSSSLEVRILLRSITILVIQIFGKDIKKGGVFTLLCLVVSLKVAILE